MPDILLSTLNARYSHASLGLRYLLANLARHGSPALRAAFATQLRSFRQGQTLPLHLSAFSAGRLSPAAYADWLATRDPLGAIPGPHHAPDHLQPLPEQRREIRLGPRPLQESQQHQAAARREHAGELEPGTGATPISRVIQCANSTSLA